MTSALDGVELPPLSIVLSPQGRLYLDRLTDAELTPSLRQIADQFTRGDGHALFRLGARRPEPALPGVLSFWRVVGRAFVVRLCATENLEQLRARIHIEVPQDELTALVAEAPPMPGGEYLTPAVLADLCARMASAIQD